MADAKNNKAVSIANAYGALNRALVEKANAEHVRVAQANFDAGRSQIEAARDQKVSELSGVFRTHIASIQANAAFRGVGGGSLNALVGSSTAEAEVARRVIDINANNAIGAEAAQATVPIDDPALAQLEGTFRGLGIGGDFVSALDSMPETTTHSTSWVHTGVGWQAVDSVTHEKQNFDLIGQFPELDKFLKGG